MKQEKHRIEFDLTIRGKHITLVLECENLAEPELQLVAEKVAILNTMLMQMMSYSPHQSGKGRHDAVDYLKRFLNDCTTPDPNSVVKSSELYNAYRLWCEINNQPIHSHTRFGRDIRKLGVPTTRIRGCVYYEGLRLLHTPTP